MWSGPRLADSGDLQLCQRCDKGLELGNFAGNQDQSLALRTAFQIKQTLDSHVVLRIATEAKDGFGRVSNNPSVAQVMTQTSEAAQRSAIP